MKQLIAPVAIIVALIAFFVIIDRKEFSRHDDVQTVQSESPTSNRKSLVSVLDTKPVTEIRSTVDPQPVVDTQPVTETKPKTDAKSAETKLKAEAKSATEASPITEAKPIETKPVAATKPMAEAKSETKPAAVPVVTAEEAVKANEEALKLLPKTETVTPSKDIKLVAENKPVPTAIPILSPEDAIKANKEAMRFHWKTKTKKELNTIYHKIENKNTYFFLILSLLPLLLVFDVLSFFRKGTKKSSKDIEYFSLQRRIRILFSVSLFAFGILVFVPWSVYFGNSLQLPFIFQDFVNWNLCALTITIIVACIILLLIPPIISDFLVAIIAGLGLCVYVQAMFMNQNLGTMDGVEPIWSEHRLFGTVNLIIWIAIVLSPIVLRIIVPTYYSKVISMATGVVLFLEILATVSMILSAGKNIWLRADTYYVMGHKQFQLSKEKNVVVFFMDTLDSGFVKSCFEIYPETKDIVKDFIWYEDARSNYLRTYPSLISELTGSLLVVPAKTENDLFDKMWHAPSAESFYKQIKDAGYDARIFMRIPDTILGSADNYHDYFSNVEARPDVSYEIDYCSLYHCLMQMSAYSSLSYFFKKYFFYSFDFSEDVVQRHFAGFSGGSIYAHNHEFLKKMISSGISSDANKPILSYHYLSEPHPPWHHDEKCNYIEEPFDNPIPTVRGCFYLLSEFIRLLKDAGLYDNTAILIIADHGNFANKKYTPDITFMIKPFYENKSELSIDKAKFQTLDLLPFLLEIISGDDADFKDFDGVPSYCIPDERIRKIYNVVKNQEYPPFDGWGSSVGQNCVEEYNLVDRETFMLGTDSKSFVRQFSLGITPQEN